MARVVDPRHHYDHRRKLAIESTIEKSKYFNMSTVESWLEL